MNMELGDTGVSLGDVSDGAKAASSLTKSLPGMAKTTEEGGAEEVKICSTCNQKIVTSQPGASTGNALEKADEAVNCCNKLFDCFGKGMDLADKGMDAADKVQSLTGE